MVDTVEKQENLGRFVQQWGQFDRETQVENQEGCMMFDNTDADYALSSLGFDRDVVGHYQTIGVEG